MERVFLRVGFGVVFAVAAWQVGIAVRKPAARRAAIIEVIQISAFLVFLSTEVLPMSANGKHAGYVVALAVMGLSFLKFVWDAKPWR